ncbi:MAG: hypothetical protein ACI4TT_03390 [Christensenellales bacterium]
MSKVNSYKISIHLEYYHSIDGKRTYSIETSTNKDRGYSPKKEYIKTSDNENYLNKIFQKTPFNVKTENIMPFFKLFDKLPETSLFIMTNDKAQKVDIEFEFLDKISPKSAAIDYNPYNMFTSIEHRYNHCEFKQTTKYVDNDVSKTIEKGLNDLSVKVATRLKEIIKENKERIQKETKEIKKAEEDFSL